MSRLKPTLDLLEKASRLVETLSDSDYAARSPLGASVGSHLRHIIDFYRCFLRDEASGRIDYDNRQRDSELERSRTRAISALRTITESLRGQSWTEGATVEVHIEATHPPDFTLSTRDREIQFILSHTIHHLALISYILTERGVSVPPDFGFAPSTLEHMRAESLAG